MLRRAAFLLSVGTFATAAFASTATAFASPSGIDVNETNASATADWTTLRDTGVQSAHLDSSHIQWQIRNGQAKSRGVNLGSWLVAENWMTREADFWRGVSAEDASAGEYTAITKASNPDTIRSNLDYHHAHFITEDEIKAIAAAGLNTVRVPVGYWIVGFDNNDPSGRAEWQTYTKNTLRFLDLLIQNWAKKHNVAVIISIHAAKGSQNGADHSSPSVKGKSYWSEYKENVDNTLAMVQFLAARYRYEDAFLGIGLLNEPTLTTKEDVLYQYYQDAYKAIRSTGNDCVLSVAPLLYKQNPDTMVDFMQAPTYKNVWVEWHPYFVWGYENWSDYDLLNVAVRQRFQGDVSKWHARANHNRLLFGEWSFATAGQFGNNKEMYYEWAAAQLKVLNQAEGGWTFWSWRIYGDENGFNGWGLRSVLRDPRFKQILSSTQ